MGQSVGLHLDPRRADPIYRQIFDQVVARIEERAFPPGYQLPPARALARELATHRNTVARAYADLEAAGFVSSRVGRGTFVEARGEAVGSQARPEPTRGLPWASMLSRAARVETIGRAEGYARRVRGTDVINLARMQPSPDLLPVDLLRRCVDRVLADQGVGAMAYAPPEGVPRLREAIAQELSARGVPANAEDVVVTSGSQQALDLLVRALVNPGDIVLVDSTTYSGAIDVFGVAGARLVPVPNDGDGPELASLQRLATPEVKLLYVMPNCHNPTGVTMTAERRRELVAWSRASGIPIVEDDYGAGIVLDERDTPPFLRALDGDVLHISTFSKRLIPALRVGFAIVPASLRPALVSMKRVMDLGTSTILQHALAEFMERGYLRGHMTRTLPEYRARRDALEAALTKHLPSDVRWTRPHYGVVLWLRLPPHYDPEAVFDEAVRQGVQISPSRLWSVDAGGGESGIRLAFCAESPPRLSEGARRLGRAFKALAGRAPKKPHGSSPMIEVV